MSDKNRPKPSGSGKPDAQKGSGAQPNPNVGERTAADKGKANTKGNAAGQGNTGDEVMPAGRETPG